MSRGRGGSNKEQYSRHPPSYLQAKEDYSRPGPAPFPPRAESEQSPNLNYYNSPARPVQPPAPLLPSAPPVPNHSDVVSSPVTFDYSQNHSGSPVPNSFHLKQAEFLRGQISEAPQFRASSGGRGAVFGWQPRSSYQAHSGYSRFIHPSSNPRGKRAHSQKHSVAHLSGSGASRGTPDPRHLYQTKNNRQGCVQTSSICDHFQSLSLQHNRSNSKGFDRHSSSSSSASLRVNKRNITFTHEIQDQVQRALAALKPGESIPAKVLAKKLDLPKKIINKALYSLEASQKAFKQGLTPPKWSLYLDTFRAEENQISEARSPPLHQHLSTQDPQNAEAEVDPETENKAQAKEEDSDTESSSSYSSSLELADSEESPAEGQHIQEEISGIYFTADQELNCPIMARQKEQILQYLLESGEATSLIIAKNLGLRTAKQVSQTLTTLEKQGDVIKDSDVTPFKWSLSPHRKEKMERSLKAAQSTVEDQMEVKKEEDSINLSPLPPVPGLEPIPLLGDWVQEQSENNTVGQVLSVLL